MGNPYFRFKQFTVWHDRCAMKVGTDGVLLGAWAGHGRPAEILDIGTGSGLIALMLAQRFPEANITGIDCDADAIRQARENFRNSPWSRRLRPVHASLQEFCRTEKGSRFDLIVSNPPFYDTTLENTDQRRNTARHTGNLSHEELLLLSAGLLTDSGGFSLIIPSGSENSIMRLADRSRLFPERLTRVLPKPGSRTGRALISFSRHAVPEGPETGNIVLQNPDGSKSEDYIRLTSGFYLY